MGIISTKKFLEHTKTYPDHGTDEKPELNFKCPGHESTSGTSSTPQKTSILELLAAYLRKDAISHGSALVSIVHDKDG